MSIDRGMDKEDVVHNMMEYYSAIKRKTTQQRWWQTQMITLSEVSGNDKDKYHMISITCMWNLTYNTDIHYT